MNTIELTSVIRKRVVTGTDFIGVLACDQLPEHKLCKYPAMLVVNTHPSDRPGEHWVAIYITKQKHGYFFDSFGNPPGCDRFPEEIINFLNHNCYEMSYSRKQVQNNRSTTCGQHCVFFLCHIQKGLSYARVIGMYRDNVVNNDAMVCRFVSRINPSVCCGDTFSCVQCASVMGI